MLLLFITASAQAPIYMNNFCDNSTSVSPSYKANVDTFLSWVTTDSYKGDGYNYTTVNNNNHNNDDDDAVYGLYSCRYDITGYFCQFCITTASKELSQRCPNTVRGIIWYDVCIIRYSNQNFIGKVSLTPTWNTTGTRKIKDSSEVKKAEDSMESLIRKATVESKTFWAVEEFEWIDNEKRYGWVQCDRVIENDECGECLHATLDIFPECCSTNVQWAIFGPSCSIRMDDQNLYQSSGNGGTSSKSRNLLISFSVLGAVALLCFSVYCFWYRKRVRKDKMMLDEEKLNGDLPTIPLIAVLHSTNNFSEAFKLGEGGFGPVYKGILPDGRQIAVKRLSKFSGQGSQEFKNEVMFIAKLQHRNLVRLLGCCLEENEKILVYEYMCNSSLDFHLFGDDEKRKQLDWRLRLSIINGIARGILYLHEDSRLKVIHRDLKASNVLLDDEMNPKISDFGLARAFEIGQNQANTKRVVGTYGYMAPEYAMEGLFSVKSDVFSFGVLVLKSFVEERTVDSIEQNMVKAWSIWCAGKCLELMDPALIKSFIASEVVKCFHIGLLCVQQDAADRPTMSTVVLMLGSESMALPKPNHPAFSVGKLTSKEASASRSSMNLSINDVTVSTDLARVIVSFLFLLFTTTRAQAPIYMYNFCENSTSVSPSYKANVDTLLSWVTTDSDQSDGYNYTTVNNNNDDDAVYGLYSCRYDITGYFCRFCITTAASELSRRCPNTVRAIIWYDICIIRYSNQSFNGKVSLTPTWNITGPKKIKDSAEAKKVEDSMESLITKVTINTKKFWAVDEFDWVDNEKRYGWVQCDRDIPSDECGECLHALLDIFPLCCSTNAQWAVFGPSCGMRMDDEKFYQSSGNGGASKTRKLIISSSVLGSVALLCFSVYCFWYRKRVRKDKMTFDEEKLNGDLPTIPLIAVLHSTNNFSEESILGEGGFGSVYKGILPDGRQIAVKRLSQFSGQGSQEFKNEVMFIAKLQHRNLVRLLGCCLEENEKILVYEYMCNASLDFYLFGDDEKRKQLDWGLRLSIINGIARGILYLHEDSRLKVIHRDLKASNVLLDDEMNPKISDFGLARAFEIGENQAKTKRVVGTYGYMAPEYAMEGLFSVKSDVFSFGVLVLEIICGRKNSGFHRAEHGQSLLLYAWSIWCAGKCLELMDPALIKSFIASEVVKCLHIGLLCVQQDAADRPTMSTVVLMLGSDTMTLPKPNHPAFSVGKLTSKEALASESSKNRSINDVTVSAVLAR
ncbi:hypothetical protein ACSQ67_024170 [Phaseolus vulgaris]